MVNSVNGFSVWTTTLPTMGRTTLRNTKCSSSTITTTTTSITSRINKKSSSSIITHLSMTEFNLPSSAPTFMMIAAATCGMIYLSSIIQKDQEKQKQYAEYEAQAKAIQEEKARKAYIEPKDFWTEEELKQYDGTLDPEGPILMAVNGKVFNVYKGRHFYGPGCEYHIFAGRDATRLLAKGKLEEETMEERQKDLTMAERATLQGWMWTFESKYQVVGKLQGFDERSTSTRTILPS